MGGGFFLVCAEPNEDRKKEVTGFLGAFAELGFASPEIVEAEGYVFAAYPKFQSKSVALERYPNGDFAFVSGTCLLEVAGLGTAGSSYQQTGAASHVSEEIMGHYAAVLKKTGQTEIKLDRFGGYHVFYNLHARVVSSSFYAICSVLDSLTLSQQRAYEYVFNGVVSGNETLFSEVRLAPIQATIVVGPHALEILRPTVPVTRACNSGSRDASLRESIALLDRYFGALARTFGDRARCALSGGYDSRLILAFLRRHGVKPDVFVYGNAQDPDVRAAREIAQGEGFPIEIIDKTDRPVIPPMEFTETARRNFLAADGLGHEGIFHNGAEAEELVRRVRGNAIAINGGGGEIFRNFFHLLDREYTIYELLLSFYSQFDPATCTEAFHSASYYRSIERKVMDLLGSDERRLPRPTIEWLYHTFRCRAWDGKVDSIAGRYGYTGMPFLERSITEHASALPLRWKNHGAYEAEIIRRVDSRLAGYLSNYGHNFNGPPPPSRRVSDYSTYLRPPWLRRYTYRLKNLALSSKRFGYLALPYQHAVLPGGPVILRQLFRLNRIRDGAQFARILSLEYTLRHFGARVTEVRT
jgi:asparagine synthase (glutamine-hydrolysing)